MYSSQPPRRQTKYPWNEWDDGQRHTIRQGADFDVPLDTMCAHLYIRAKQHHVGVFVSRSTISGTIVFQFYRD